VERSDQMDPADAHGLNCRDLGPEGVLAGGDVHKPGEHVSPRGLNLRLLNLLKTFNVVAGRGLDSEPIACLSAALVVICCYLQQDMADLLDSFREGEVGVGESDRCRFFLEISPQRCRLLLGHGRLFGVKCQVLVLLVGKNLVGCLGACVRRTGTRFFNIAMAVHEVATQSVIFDIKLEVCAQEMKDGADSVDKPGPLLLSVIEYHMAFADCDQIPHVVVAASKTKVKRLVLDADKKAGAGCDEWNC